MWEEFRNLISYRELIIKLALKDLKVRYRRPFFGFLWAFLIPLSRVIIFQIVFSIILRVPIEGYPFFIYLMTAIFPWRFFQVSISRSTTSVLDNKYLVKEAFFPRELIPISVVFSELINFIPSLIIMFVFLFFFRINISSLIIYLPLVVFLHTMFITGFSLLMASLQVKYRDVKYIVEILLILLFYLSPVFYSLNTVAKFFNKISFRIYLLNPLVGILNLYRTVFLKGFTETLPSEVTIFNTFVWPIVFSLTLFFTGFYAFKNRESSFSDYISI